MFVIIIFEIVLNCKINSINAIKYTININSNNNTTNGQNLVRMKKVSNKVGETCQEFCIEEHGIYKK